MSGIILGSRAGRAAPNCKPAEVFVVSAAASVGSGRSPHIDFVKYPATLALFQKVVGCGGSERKFSSTFFKRWWGVGGKAPKV